MARPRDPKKERWPSRRFKIGFVENYRNEGVAWVRIGAWRKSLSPLRFLPENRKLAVDLLDKLIESGAYEYPPSSVKIVRNGDMIFPDSKSSIVPKKGVTIKALRDAYFDFYQQKITDGMVVPGSFHRIESAFEFFFKGKTSLPLDPPALARAISVTIKKSTNKVSTIEGYVSSVKSAFRWGVQNGYLEKDPVPMMKNLIAPNADRNSKSKLGFEPDEVTAILAAMRKDGHEDKALFVELYWLTAMRNHEALLLKSRSWLVRNGYTEKEIEVTPHVAVGSHLLIAGKGKHGRKRYRMFPLYGESDGADPAVASWLRRTNEVVTALCEQSDRHAGYLVGHRSEGTTLYWLRRYIDHCKLNPDYDVQALRRGALTHMTYELSLTEDFLDRTVGNSRKVRDESYLGMPTRMQLLRMLPGVIPEEVMPAVPLNTMIIQNHSESHSENQTPATQVNRQQPTKGIVKAFKRKSKALSEDIYADINTK